MREFQQTIAAVQKNCDISDARHAREMTMCNYLLGMRELYIWENDIRPSQHLVKEDLSRWLTQREAYWEEVEALDYQPIPIVGREYDPFDVSSINAQLESHGLVYGGGLGRWCNPHFFLGQLVRSEQRHGLMVRVSGCEYARDIHASPAALREGAVYLRTDALQRWLQEKIEMWSIRQADGALKAALDCYGATGDLSTLLQRMAERETETLILHEVGEAAAEPLLGPAWRDMIMSFTSRKSIVLARSIRDHLADCLSTLPELIARGEACSLHFYFSNFDGLRRSLYPRLVKAYEHWRDTGDLVPLQAAVEAGRLHWQWAAQHLLNTWQADPVGAQSDISDWAELHGPLAL